MNDDGEIRSLLARLAQLADRGDVDAYVELWTDDAVSVMPAVPQTGVAAAERRGRAEIAAAARERLVAAVQGPGTNTAHVVTTVAVEIGGDSATAESTWLFLADTTTTPRIASFGRYHDTLLRTTDGWRLASRRITLG